MCPYLHSTMYLLNPRIRGIWAIDPLFTFHYVSIKSKRTCNNVRFIINLHSTMYLLNRNVICPWALSASPFTFHYVSIKSATITSKVLNTVEFTFHYVSIKSAKDVDDLKTSGNLHSTMYLLNLFRRLLREQSSQIYIPLCIY